MTIIELLQKVGADNIQVQNVENAMEGADYSKKKGGVTIKLFTTAVTCDDLMHGQFSKVGLIVWFDRALWTKEEEKKTCLVCGIDHNDKAAKRSGKCPIEEAEKDSPAEELIEKEHGQQAVNPHCHSASDGECFWKGCPQLREGEPHKTGRHCPLPKWEDEES